MSPDLTRLSLQTFAIKLFDSPTMFRRLTSTLCSFFCFQRAKAEKDADSHVQLAAPASMAAMRPCVVMPLYIYPLTSTTWQPLYDA